MLLSVTRPPRLPEVPPDGPSKITQPCGAKRLDRPRHRRASRSPRSPSPDVAAARRPTGIRARRRRVVRAVDQPVLPRGHHRPRRARSGRRSTKLAKLFPAYPKLRKMIDDSLQGDDVNFETDVKPLLGDRAAIAALNVPNVSGHHDAPTRPARPAPRENALRRHRSSASWTSPTARTPPSRRWWSRAARTKAGEHDGVTYYKAKDDGTLTAVTDGALVVTDSQPASSRRSTRTRRAATRPSPARASSPTRSASSRPTSSRRRYVDVGDASCARRHRPEPAARAARPLEDYQNAVVAASVAAEPDGVRVKGVVDGAPDNVPTGGEFSPDPRRPTPRPTRSPTSASATWPVSSPRSSRQVQGSLGKEQVQQFDAFSAQLPLLLGVSLDDLTALGSGEHALVVTDGQPNPGAALALKVEDGARAKTTLDTAAARLPALMQDLQPATRAPAVEPGSAGRRRPGVAAPALARGRRGVRGRRRPGDHRHQRRRRSRRSSARPRPLSASADFQAATDGMPDTVTSVVWVNLQQGIGALQRFGALKDAAAGDPAQPAPAEEHRRVDDGRRHPDVRDAAHARQ